MGRDFPTAVPWILCAALKQGLRTHEWKPCARAGLQGVGIVCEHRVCQVLPTLFSACSRLVGHSTLKLAHG